jgi:cellulose synthase operon protein C
MGFEMSVGNERRTRRWSLALAACFALACLLPASLAMAQDEGEEEKGEVGVKAFKREKKEERKKVEAKGPQYKGKTAEREFKLQAQQKRDEAIRLLGELIDATEDEDPEKPKFLFGLSELLWEKSRFYEQAAFRTQDEMYAARDRKDRASEERLKRRMNDELKEASRQREEAVRIYAQIINNHPDFDQLDDVYFYLGVNLMEINKRPQALNIFRELIKKYPDSSYVPNVLLAFGEYYFDNDDMNAAKKAYQKVLEFKDAEVRTYALYKLAWCHYNLTAYAAALDTFLDVLKVTEKGSKRDKALRKETLRDIVITYSHIGKPSKALPFFKKLVKSQGDVLYMGERLAQLYADIGKFSDSTDLFRKLISMNRTSFKVMDYQLEIVRNVEALGVKVDAVKEVLRATKLLGVAKGFKDAEPGLVKDTATKLEFILREYATTYHREAQKTRNDETYALAYELYKVYLDAYPDSEDRYVMTFFYAELLYRLKKFDEAAVRYEACIKINPKGQYSKEAVHASVLSYQKLVAVSQEGSGRGIEIDVKGDGKKAEGVPKKKTIPDVQASLIRAADRYVEVDPNGRSVVKVKYTAARIYYDHNHFDEAIKRFDDIVKNHSNDRLAVVAANLSLDSYYLTKNYAGLDARVREYLANPDLIRDAEFEAVLLGIAEKSAFKKCYDMEDDKKWEEAARCFTQDFYRSYPDSELVDEALYNAALDFERVRQIGKAIEVRKGLLELRPDSEYAPETLYNIGASYHGIAVYSEASKFYELFIQYFPTHEKAEPALLAAALFREGLGDYDEAISNFEKYLELFPKKKEEGAEVKFRIARILEEQKQQERAAFAGYQEYIKKYGSVGKTDLTLEARTRIGLILWKNRKYKDALKEFQKVVDIYVGLREGQRADLTTGADAAAQAMFMLGEWKLKQAEAVKLKLPEKVFKKRMAEKIAIFGEADGIYKDVVKFGRPSWSIAGFYRLGYVKQSFAKEIREAPVPPGLDYEQEELYKGALEEQATVIEEQSVSDYKQCLDVALRASWFNKYSKECEVSLAGLRPREFRKPSELRAEPFNDRPGYVRAGVEMKAVADDQDEAVGEGE